MPIGGYVTGLQHIGLPTGNMSKTCSFYEGLGFAKEYETMNGNCQVVFLKLCNVIIEAYEVSDCAMASGAWNHIALNVTTVGEAYEAVKAAGYRIVSNGIETLPFFERGVSFFIIEGPNKERVEFNQYL